MSKTIISPVQRWAGTVTIADPLTIPQAQLVEAGMSVDKKGNVFLSEIDSAQLPAIFACVEKWQLAGMPEPLTLDNFPASPRVDSHKLIEWLFKSVWDVYFGELEIPKELKPTPTDTPAKDSTV